MRPPLALALLVSFAGVLIAQNGSVAALFASVRSALQQGQSDRQIAQAIGREKLSEKLEDAVVEELQSAGAGPETMEALDQQQELSEKLPVPAQPLELFDTPPTPSAAEQSQTLHKTREIALQYTAALPNFLCTETVRRFMRSKSGDDWKPVDTLTIDLAYSEKGEQYRLAAMNGRSTTKKLSDVGGVMSNGEFGSLLKTIFDPKSTTAFQWERWTRLRGRLTYVFSYRIDQKHSQYTINWNTLLRHYHGTYAMSGAVYIDRETGQVMQFSDQGEGIPAGWPVLATRATVDYDYAGINGQKFLLPRSVDSRVTLKSGESRNRVEFQNYRKFSAETNLTFDK